MNSTNQRLSLIIPCYNESDNLNTLFNSLLEIDNNLYEIIFVNNGSSDNTKSVLVDLIKNDKSKYHLINIDKNIGYGHGIMTGVKRSKGDIIAWTHADLQTHPKDVVNAFNIYIQNPDYDKSIIKGKRLGRNLFDSFFTFSMAIISSILLGIKLSDINAQPKMFHRKFLNELKNFPNDFSLDLYLLYNAKIKGYSILECPVNFEKRIYGQSKGGGSIVGKLKLIKRTLSYMFNLRGKLKN